ncbi:MAG: hypothetical protein P1P74_09245 [Desulfuromonadales bacterium]|nr:hypothetical protein [Desulfuromonadales bacterium]MDT8423834.1 hypothetical protein [Desulfuromonadales bacterium]
MSTRRTIKAIVTMAALRVGETLLFFAFRTEAIHFAIGQIIGEQQSTTGTTLRVTLADRGPTRLLWTDKDRFAALAPIFSFLFFFANWTFFHNNLMRCDEHNKKAGPQSPACVFTLGGG